MNYNRKKHYLLKILAKQNIKSQLGIEGFYPVGVSYEKIYAELQVTDYQLIEICAELYENKEIGYHNAYEIEGLYIENIGIASHISKKYLKKETDRNFEVGKNFVQIIIPVLSLIIALVAILKNYQTTSELATKKELNKIKIELEENLKNHLIDKK